MVIEKKWNAGNAKKSLHHLVGEGVSANYLRDLCVIQMAPSWPSGSEEDEILTILSAPACSCSGGPDRCVRVALNSIN